MINEVILEGIVVRDPWKYMDDLFFRLVVYRDSDQPAKKLDQQRDAGDYVNIRLKGAANGLIQVRKGMRLRIHGFLQSRDYLESLNVLNRNRPIWPGKQVLFIRRHTMYHTIILIGNLGKDPETRYTPSGQSVTSLSVATNRKYSDALGQSVKETSWFRVTVWGKQAEACNTNLHKGSKVLVEGRLTPDPQTGGPRIWKTDGQVNAQYEVTASVVRFLSGREALEEKIGSRNEMDTQDSATDLDDIPF